MTGRHYLLIAGCLTGIGTMMGALPNWHAAITPQFIGGAIVVLGSTIGSIFTDRP